MRNAAYVRDLAETIGLKVWPSFVERACCDKKEIYLNGGWRGGKSHSAAFSALISIIEWLKEPGERLVWLVGPDYEQARPEYRYIVDWCTRLGIQAEASVAQQGSLRMVITCRGLPGTIEVVTKQAGDPTSLGSVAPDLILGCECGQFSEEAREWIEGRTTEKNASVIWSGTFHNDQGKQQFVWYEQISAQVKATPTPRRQAFCLPSWENEYLYGNCLEGENSILNDPTLAVWCPEGEHGPGHKGMNHPVMRMRHEAYRDKPREWDKRFGGIPQGVSNPVYEWSLRDSLTDFTGNRYLVPMPESMRGGDYRWLRSAGGMDFGTVHPSAASVVSMTQTGDTWVRRCPQDRSGRMDWIWTTQAELSQLHHIPANMWGRDPMVKYAPSYVPGEAMSGSLFAREARVGICNGVAESGHLYFDASNPEIVVLFGQIQRLHRKRQANGQLAYVREDDDGPAAWEDAMAMLHGQPVMNLPKRWSVPKKAPRRYALQPARSVS